MTVTKKLFIASFALFIIASIALIATGIQIRNALLQPVDPQSEEKIIFNINEGSGAQNIVQRLKEENLVKNDFWLKTFVRATNVRFAQGLYELSPAMSPLEIIRIIESGKVMDVQVTTIEGWRVEEVARRLANNNLLDSMSDFKVAVLASQWRELDKFELEPQTTIEGFLFPDTYRFAHNSSINTVIKRMIDNFISRTANLDLTYNDLILASIVEREALFPEDRARIAGVYKNRLNIGMRLDADPTVQYGKTNNTNPTCTLFAVNPTFCPEFNFWQVIFRSDYQGVDSEWNTYRRNTLPPTPIANPGLASIEAALNPENHNYFYFVTGLDGRAHFARTLAEHNANIARYRN